ncbi:hypothetical protein KY304_02680, partial [Candidatus Woesearchaeota archaeon]|nr:hypothetical protein [Candidatus Woesearchaeota archaeon]
MSEDEYRDYEDSFGDEDSFDEDSELDVLLKDVSEEDEKELAKIEKEMARVNNFKKKRKDKENTDFIYDSAATIREKVLLLQSRKVEDVKNIVSKAKTIKSVPKDIRFFLGLAYYSDMRDELIESGMKNYLSALRQPNALTKKAVLDYIAEWFFMSSLENQSKKRPARRAADLIINKISIEYDDYSEMLKFIYEEQNDSIVSDNVHEHFKTYVSIPYIAESVPEKYLKKVNEEFLKKDILMKILLYNLISDTFIGSKKRKNNSKKKNKTRREDNILTRELIDKTIKKYNSLKNFI